jgi:hypothetical protein
MRFRELGTLLATVAGLTLVAAPVAAQPLKRDLASYFLFAQRFARLKNISIDTPCNVGVNCAAPNASSECGELLFDAATFVDGSQTVGDRTFCTEPGAVVSQLFRNSGGACNTITLLHPPIEPFDPTPIIPGTCDPGCIPNVAALEALCGFPDPFPDCNPGLPVKAKAGEDCNPLAVDTVPNNGRCDLAPGVYGDVSVRNKALMALGSGNYDVCTFKVGRNANVTADAAVIRIPDGGEFKGGGGSNIAQDCGELTVLLKGSKGRVTFGRGLNVAAKICIPAGAIKMGHSNRFLGQLVADFITANRDNHGECCGAHCTCIDSFSPTSAKAGDTLTLVGNCDLNLATGVEICGVPAIITNKTATELKVTVPAVAPQQCTVRVLSATGFFDAASLLTVTP